MSKSEKEVLRILKEQDFLNGNDIDSINEILKHGKQDYSDEILNILEEKYLNYNCELALEKIKEMSNGNYLKATELLRKLNK